MTKKLAWRLSLAAVVVGFALSSTGCAMLEALLSGVPTTETEKSREIFEYAEKVFNETKVLTLGNLKSKLAQKFGGNVGPSSGNEAKEFVWVLPDGKEYLLKLNAVPLREGSTRASDSANIISLVSCKEMVPPPPKEAKK